MAREQRTSPLDGRDGGRACIGVQPRRCVALAGVAALLAIGSMLPVVSQAGAAAPKKWATAKVPTVANYPLKSVSCSGAGCVAIGAECSVGGCGGLLPAKSFFSSTKGVSWKDASVSRSVGDATAVSCGSPLLCVATAIKGPLGPKDSSAIIVTPNGGKSWAVHDERKYTLDDAACATKTSCVALGSIKGASSALTSLGLVTSNRGASWSKAGFPAKKAYVLAVSCGTATSCVAVGENATYRAGLAFVSSNVGKSWKLVKVPAGTLGLLTVSCDGLVCAATTSTQVLVSKNGGKSWKTHLLPAGVNFQGAACMTATRCALVGYANAVSHTTPVVEATSNGGATWSKQALPKADGSLNGVACEPTSCVAVGVRVTYAGSTPKAEYPLILRY